MSSGSPLPYPVRYDSDSASLVYQFQDGWIAVPLAPPGSAVWGDITGTLSNQTDLQSALNAKAPLASPTFTTNISTPKITGTATNNVIKPTVDAVNAWDFTQADGTTSVMSVDTNSARIGFGTKTPGKLVDINGDGKIAGTWAIGSILGLPALPTSVINTLPLTIGYSAYDSTLHELKISDGSSYVPVGGGSPAGSDTQIQFNSSGAFGASPNLTFTDGPASLALNAADGNSPEVTFSAAGNVRANIAANVSIATPSSLNIGCFGTAGCTVSFITNSGQGVLVADNGTDSVLSLNSSGTPDPSAILDISSSNGNNLGFLPPKVTTTQKNAITSPAEGLVVYDVTLHKLCVFGASAWETITSV